MNKLIMIGVSALLSAGCTYQPSHQRLMPASESGNTKSVIKSCESMLSYEEKRNLLAAIPEESEICTEVAIQAVEQARRAAMTAYNCGQKETYEYARVLGKRFTLARHGLGGNIELSLDAADKALQNNCIDAADEIYRSAISTTIRILKPYDPILAGSLNDRAKIGVDDVRAARGKTSKN